MGATLLDGLPALLQTLTSTPHPDEVAAALVTGLGRQFDAASGAIVWARGPKLIVLGLHGYLPDEVAGLDAVPIASDYTLSRAYREGVPVIESIRTAGERFPHLLREGGRWRHTVARFPDGMIINAPIVSRGQSIGGFAMTCREYRPISDVEHGLIEAVSSALGLWMEHPDSGLVNAGEAPDVELTNRQCRILVLVEAGCTNAAIAAGLRCSQSTVKQEIRRILGLLDTPDRASSARLARDLGLLPDRP